MSIRQEVDIFRFLEENQRASFDPLIPVSGRLASTNYSPILSFSIPFTFHFLCHIFSQWGRKMMIMPIKGRSSSTGKKYLKDSNIQLTIELPTLPHSFLSTHSVSSHGGKALLVFSLELLNLKLSKFRQQLKIYLSLWKLKWCSLFFIFLYSNLAVLFKNIIIFLSQNFGHLLRIRGTHNGSQTPQYFIFGVSVIKESNRVEKFQHKEQV